MGFPEKERQRRRERVGEQEEQERKAQQCDPAEFMIILLKHMLAMVKTWHREHTQSVCRCMYSSVCVCVGAHAVFVPVALVLHKSVRMCVLAGVSGGEGEFLSHVPPCWLP